MEQKRSVRRVTLTLLLLAVMVCGTSCRDTGSDQEHADGIQFRNKLREHECIIAATNDIEFEFSQRLMLKLDSMKNAELVHQKKERWTEDEVKVLVKEIEDFVVARNAIKENLQGVRLKTPLPLAIRYDVAEVLDERISVSRKWKIRLERMFEAFKTDDEVLIADQIRRTYEVFQSYGMPLNDLKVAADELEEGLRLPWYSSPNPCKPSELKSNMPAIIRSSKAVKTSGSEEGN